MSKLHIWKEETVSSEGSATARAVIESEDGGRRELWYRVPDRFADRLTDSCDPFVVGALFAAMREASDLVVHGRVSTTLMANLEEFQSAWSAWLPGKYRTIGIAADEEEDDKACDRPKAAVAAVSGGVDGSFTVYRHSRGLAGRSTKDVRAGVFIHGLDIPLDRADIYEAASAKNDIMLRSLGIELIPMATNYRELGDLFRDSHGAAVASSLLFLQDRYSAGLIASTEPYADMTFPWGSNPLTDRMMSSGRLEIVHDGAAYTRCGKIEVISDWEEALKYLRVCWQSDNMDRNCCRCEKCIRTILNMRVLGVGLPECFEHDVSDSMIRRMKGLNIVAVNFLQEILDLAKEKSISESWVSALEKTVARNRKALGGWRKWINDQRNRIALRTRLKNRFSVKEEGRDDK